MGNKIRPSSLLPSSLLSSLFSSLGLSPLGWVKKGEENDWDVSVKQKKIFLWLNLRVCSCEKPWEESGMTWTTSWEPRMDKTKYIPLPLTVCSTWRLYLRINRPAQVYTVQTVKGEERERCRIEKQTILNGVEFLL